jgi:hypothetical protein
MPDRAEKFLDKLGLPDWANPATRMEERALSQQDRRNTAERILDSLGADGKPALPSLVRMYRRGDESELENVVQFMAPMAPQLGFMVQELTNRLRTEKPGDLRAYSDIRLLGEIGPPAEGAAPFLFQFTQAKVPPIVAPLAAVALWNIVRATNVLISVFSNSLIRHDLAALGALRELEWAAPFPRPLSPVLEQALYHPEPRVRREAAILLAKFDPDHLRRVALELNDRQASLLQDHLKLLASTNALDRLNAMMAIRFMGPEAVDAVPRLAQIICLPRSTQSWLTLTNSMGAVQEASVALSTLQAIGSGAAPATPTLLGLLKTRPDLAYTIFAALSTCADDSASAIPVLSAFIATNKTAEVLPAVRALATISPGDPNANEILRHAAVLNPPLELGRWHLDRVDPYVCLSASVTLWKLGLETNSPMDRLISELHSNNQGWAASLLGEIGPPARRALPELEKSLGTNSYSMYLDSIALAICKIDPEEAKRLGLPGLFIICPDKY